MKIKYETSKLVCDCCDTELYDSGIRSNCGKFQEPYIVFGEIDLCYTCAGKIFYQNILKDISKKDLQEYIKSLKKAESNNPIGPNIELVNIF